MQTGTIARLTDKGFGFIKIEGAEKDLFFHINELQDIDFNSLSEGDVLEFEVEETQKGPQAVKVHRPTEGAESTDEGTEAEAESTEA